MQGTFININTADQHNISDSLSKANFSHYRDYHAHDVCLHYGSSNRPFVFQFLKLTCTLCNPRSNK